MAKKWYCPKCISTYRLTPSGPPKQTRCESPKCKLVKRSTYCREVER